MGKKNFSPFWVLAIEIRRFLHPSNCSIPDVTRIAAHIWDDFPESVKSNYRNYARWLNKFDERPELMIHFNFELFQDTLARLGVKKTDGSQYRLQFCT